MIWKCEDDYFELTGVILMKYFYIKSFNFNDYLYSYLYIFQF